MDKNMIAKATTTINAKPEAIWNALTDRAALKDFMFGSDVQSDWKQGSNISWKGEWQGKSYEDKGKVLQVKPHEKLQYTHFSPLAGLPDKPENYHTITIDLSREGAQTKVTLSQDNNATEQEREHSQKNWEMMLASLKKYVEGKRS